jgi:thioredoxin reductase (NADPH)
MSTPMGARPAILVVSDDDQHRAQIKRALDRWFANDYTIREVETPAELLGVARQLRDSDVDVALVIAKQQMEPETGTALLGRVRDLLPTSRRVILTGWEDAGLERRR